MKKIKLTQGKYALVDDEDFEYLNQWSWFLTDKGYAMRATHIGSAKNGTRKPLRLRMHRVVNKTPKGMQTDHINHNKLDNRKSNLRTVTNKQNHFNMPLQKNNTSGHAGVHFSKPRKRWIAQIKVDGKLKYIGAYVDKEDAVRERKNKELIYHAI